MIKTLTQNDFINETNKYSEGYKDKFTYEGKIALFKYLEEYENDSDTKIEFDYIALCCEYTEYENLEELQANYTSIEDMEDLQNHTQVIPIEGTQRFIIANY